MLRTTIVAAVATAALFGFQAVRPESAHAAAPKIETAPSVGVFEQPPSDGWGSVGRILDPAHATIVSGIQG